MTQSPLRVLVIDDSALYRKFVRSVVEELPNVVVVGSASNGRIGLEQIKTLRPDLITLDLEMPELDGLGLLRDLSVRDVHIASLVITSLTDEGAKATNTALQLGAFDFVLKPVGKNPEDCRAKLRDAMAPKIEAFVSTQRHRDNQSNSNVAPQSGREEAVRKMSQQVQAVHLPPQIIGIGVSTGGPKALNHVLPRLPAKLPCPVLLVQHMPPKFTRRLAEDLDRLCALKILEAEDGMVAKPGHVLIAPGGSQMRVAKIGGKPTVQITDDPPERNCRPSVDYLFRSLAHGWGDRSMGVIMTGMGDDGTLGSKLMKRKGARIVTQDQASCVVYGMPRSVFEAGLSDEMIPLEGLAEAIVGNFQGGISV